MTQLTTLANGVRIVSQAMPHVETVAIGLHVDTGARLETERTNGVAHLLEHMVFKGTATRSARDIAEVVEDAGGSLNAYTARDMTVFHARLLAGDAALGLEIIADLVRAPRFDEDELAREKAVVLQELGEARDTPDDIVFDHLQAAAFPDQALGRSILGDEASLAAITADDLRDWLSTQYRGGSCIVAAAGKVDHDALVTLSERLFGDLASGTRPVHAAAQFAPGAVHDRRKFEQAHLTFGAAAPGHDQPDTDAVALFVMAAGAARRHGCSRSCAEERGPYTIYAGTTPYADAGLFSVYLATAKKDARARSTRRRRPRRHRRDPAPDELARAKAQVRAGLLMEPRVAGRLAEFLARQLLAHGRLQSPADLVARIDAVGLDHVRAAAGLSSPGPMPSPSRFAGERQRGTRGDAAGRVTGWTCRFSPPSHGPTTA